MNINNLYTEDYFTEIGDNMRQLTLIITTVSLLVGGVPQKISYQGYVTHADGMLVEGLKGLG